jgi:hypothetical protein
MLSIGQEEQNRGDTPLHLLLNHTQERLKELLTIFPGEQCP